MTIPKFPVTVPYVFTVTVVEAEVADAIARLPLDAVHTVDESAKAPDAEAESDTELPESYHPSPVGEAPMVGEYVPVRVVVSVHVLVPVPVIVVPEIAPPAQLFVE